MRSRGLRDDALSTRRTAEGRAGPVRCSARVPLSRRWRPWETRPSRRTIARRGPRPRLHRWRRKLKRSITGKGTTQASQGDLPGGLRKVTPRSLGTLRLSESERGGGAPRPTLLSQRPATGARTVIRGRLISAARSCMLSGVQQRLPPSSRRLQVTLDSAGSPTQQPEGFATQHGFVSALPRRLADDVDASRLGPARAYRCVRCASGPC